MTNDGVAGVDEVEAGFEGLRLHDDDDVFLVGVVEDVPEEPGTGGKNDAMKVEIASLARVVDDADGDVAVLAL